MREIRSYGSVRGVVGDCYPYRDSQSGFGFVGETSRHGWNIIRISKIEGRATLYPV